MYQVWLLSNVHAFDIDPRVKETLFSVTITCHKAFRDFSALSMFLNFGTVKDVNYS